MLGVGWHGFYRARVYSCINDDRTLALLTVQLMNRIGRSMQSID